MHVSVVYTVRSNFSDTEAPRISTFQGSRNSDKLFDYAPTFPTAEKMLVLVRNWPYGGKIYKFGKNLYC